MQIKQAVILCGGLGQRLMPLTKDLPKPMVRVLGKPFLDHLINQLTSNSIKKIVLLTGFCGDLISSYFGDGANWGCDIQYSSGDVEWETSRRIYEAVSMMDDDFLLLYGDNYAKLDFAQLFEAYQNNNQFLVTIKDVNDKGNIYLKDDFNIYYNNDQLIHKYIDIGYMAVNREFILKTFNKNKELINSNFSNFLKLAGDDNLSIKGFVLDGDYKTMTYPSDVIEMEKFINHE